MKDNYKEHLLSDSKLYMIDPHSDSIDWKNKTQWIDSEPKLKLNLLSSNRLSDAEYWKQQREIREIMELNMVLYGRW